MKKYVTYAFMIWFAAITMASADDKTTCMANENAAWQAYKDKKADDFKKVVDKDLRVVDAEGVSDLQKEIDDMKRWDIKSFTISGWDAFTDEPDVVVATYKVALQGTIDGQDISGDYNCGTVWKKEGSNWLAILHSGVKAAPAGK